MNKPWTITHCRTAESTNLLAAQFPEWHAIRADVQTAGRGRFQRSWVSNEGGLWLSAVVPVDIRSDAGRLLSLIAGLAVCDALREFGVTNLRLRWPNDVMIDDRKIAGLLIDCFCPGRAVVGIGINVFNRPEEENHELSDFVMRLADVAKKPVTLNALEGLVLASLRGVVIELLAGRQAGLLERVNALWSMGGRVELDLDTEIRQGRFGGIDAHGEIILIDERGAKAIFAPEQTRHLSELT